MSGFLIQSHFGSMGNFEVVVPSRAAGGLVHFWRNNDDPSLPWGAPTVFGLGLQFGFPSLIQGNFGSPGNLEVVVGTFGGSAELVHFYRDSIGWHGPDIAETGV